MIAAWVPKHWREQLCRWYGHDWRRLHKKEYAVYEASTSATRKCRRCGATKLVKQRKPREATA